MKKFKASINLHNKLRELFPGGATEPYYNIACEIIRYISKKSLKKTGTDSNYIEFGIRLQRIKFSSRANKVLQLLKKEGILECYSSKNSCETYTVKYEIIDKRKIKLNENGVCKKYRITSIYSYTNYLYNIYQNTNNKLLSPLLCTEGLYVKYNAVSKRYSNKKRSDADKQLYKDFLYTLDELEIDYVSILEKIRNNVNSIKIDKFKLNEEIQSEKFEVMFLNSGKKKWITKTYALNLAEQNYETLIQDGKNFYIGGKEQFLEYKKRNTLYSATDSLDRLREGDLYAKRNKTNGRLDTNFTNMSSTILKEIMYQNNLVSIDLANSQFAILAYKMEKEGYDTSDFTLFKEAVYKGKLYDEATELLKYNNRDETKTGFFESIFSKSSTKSNRKDKLFALYPTVMSYIDKIKIEGKYTDLSIGLQKEESTIFIDQLYPLLKKKIGTVITKHDSFIVKKEEVQNTLNIIQQHFNEIGFKGKMVKEN